MNSSEKKQDSLIGVTINERYRILSPLGAGGFGTVYLAEDLKENIRLAIKIAKPATSRRIEQLTAGRFMAEAKALAALDHENIIKVLGAGVDDGREYMVLEYLEGNPLNRYLRKHAPLSLDDTLALVAQASCGLAYAHNRAIIHRDLKPPNLFVKPIEGNPLHLKILDFGIAKINDRTIATLHTQEKAPAMGTPGFTAPEQAFMMKDVDHRADLYSLAAITFLMLTGRIAFQPDRREFPNGQAPWEAFIANQLYSEPPDVRAFRPNAPGAWAQLLIQSLDKDPKKRPPDVTTFVQVLAATTPNGTEIVKHVAPLLASERWLQATYRMARPEALTSTPTSPTIDAPTEIDLEPPEPLAPEPTTAYETLEDNEEISIDIDLASSPVPTVRAKRAMEVPRREGSAHRGRRWPLALLIASIGLVAIATLALVTQEGKKQTLASVEADAGALGTTQATDASSPNVDAAPTAQTVKPDAAPRAKIKTENKAVKKKRPPKGRLRVKVLPWGTVYIDGRNRGQSPINTSLPIGQHRITIKGPEGKTKTLTVDIRKGETERVSHKWR